MKFKIGEDFWAGEQQYRCTDIGSRVVVAIRVDRVHAVEYSSPDRKKTRRTLNKAEAEVEGWFKGPPYAVAERVFDEDDLEVCETEDQQVDRLTDDLLSIVKAAVSNKSRSAD